MIVQKTTNHVVGLWHHMAPIFKPGLLMPLLLQVTVRSLCHSRGVTADYLKFQERFQMKKALVFSVGGRWEKKTLGRGFAFRATFATPKCLLVTYPWHENSIKFPGKSVNPKILHPIQFLPAICNTPRETLLLIGDVGGVEAHWSQLIQPAVCAAVGQLGSKGSTLPR